jgi:hypothetical protein
MSSGDIQRRSGAINDEGEVPLADEDVHRLRYEKKQEDDGAAVNADRKTMYDDLTGVGESGSQGDNPQTRDQNKIGPNG